MKPTALRINLPIQNQGTGVTKTVTVPAQCFPHVAVVSNDEVRKPGQKRAHNIVHIVSGLHLIQLDKEAEALALAVEMEQDFGSILASVTEQPAAFTRWLNAQTHNKIWAIESDSWMDLFDYPGFNIFDYRHRLETLGIDGAREIRYWAIRGWGFASRAEANDQARAYDCTVRELDAEAMTEILNLYVMH